MGALKGMYGFQSSTVGKDGPFASIRGIASWSDLRAFARGCAWVRIFAGTTVAWEGPGDAMPEREPDAPAHYGVALAPTLEGPWSAMRGLLTWSEILGLTPHERSTYVRITYGNGAQWTGPLASVPETPPELPAPPPRGPVYRPGA